MHPVINVSCNCGNSPSKGLHKRDISVDRVRSSAHDRKLQFLYDFAKFLNSWECSRLPGLTRENFLVLRYTWKSLSDCANHYLLDCLGFIYVLLDKNWFPYSVIPWYHNRIERLKGCISNQLQFITFLWPQNPPGFTVYVVRGSLSQINTTIQWEASACQSDPTYILADANLPVPWQLWANIKRRLHLFLYQLPDPLREQLSSTNLLSVMTTPIMQKLKIQYRVKMQNFTA